MRFHGLLAGLALAVGADHLEAQDMPPVQLLGAKQYRIRETTHDTFRRALQADPPLISVDHFEGPFGDPEIGMRAVQLREEYIRTLRPKNIPTLPWIDMLPGTGHPNASHIVSEYLAKSGGHGKTPLWHGDMEATRLWVRDLVTQRVPREQILGTLNAMGEVQIKSTWYKEYMAALLKNQPVLKP
jgi:hypothetical protein